MAREAMLFCSLRTRLIQCNKVSRKQCSTYTDLVETGRDLNIPKI